MVPNIDPCEAQVRRDLTNALIDTLQLCYGVLLRLNSLESDLKNSQHTTDGPEPQPVHATPPAMPKRKPPRPSVTRTTEPKNDDDEEAENIMVSDLPTPISSRNDSQVSPSPIREKRPSDASVTLSTRIPTSTEFGSATYDQVAPAKTSSHAVVVTDDLGFTQLNQYVLEGDIGEGSQGRVVLALDLNTNQRRAIKIIQRPQMSGGGIGKHNGGTRQYIQMQREIAIMKRCRHKNVVALYEVIDDEQASMMYLVMQYVEKGSLRALSNDGRTDPIPCSLLANYARQLCAGLHYLHLHGVVHRDIKPENILLDANDHVYLSDFGLGSFVGNHLHESLLSEASFGGPQHEDSSRSITSPSKANTKGKQHTHTQGTIAFLSPELLNSVSNDDKLDSTKAAELVDVWALGMTLYVLLYGALPLDMSSIMACMRSIASSVIPYPDVLNDKDGHPLRKVDFHADWVDLLSGMLDRNRETRLTAFQAHAKAKAIHLKYTAREREGLRSPVAHEVTDSDVTNALSMPTYRRQQQ